MRCPWCNGEMEFINNWAGHRCGACLTFTRPDGSLFYQSGGRSLK